ncbi:MAG TPA: short-chain dehydrogenase [Syntrophaceae bacterium]|jgi:NAD(P)-dependent dehydrogenase (short-subunit alcohol dehydrogenase family)|nr:short-chain dehydrogenase [Syntrophaceae bacterium]HCX01782.1 short-chain dehydrogenase [Syntrophaceae bacterium]
MDVAGKIIIVTGAASGIGRGLCQRFAKEGAKAIIAADVNEAGAKAVADEVKGEAFACDVRKESDIINLAKFTEDKYGRIDLFCSNAGIIAIGGYEVDNEAWQRIWEINVLAHVFAARAVIPGMIKRGGGAFLITASAAGLLSQIGSLPYSVTKHAAVGLAENLSITYGDQGIQVFALCPQAVETEMTRQHEGGGVAGVDGLMKPEQLADAVMEAFAADQFLILPHPEVKTYMQRKAADYSRWLQGMRRLQERFMTGAPLKK